MGMPLHVMKLFQILDEKYDISKVSILGASYKANVGDTRNSPGLQVAEGIRAQGKEVAIHDPYIKEYRHDLVEVLSGSDLMVIPTDHDYYREKLEPEEVGTIMNNRLAIDTRAFSMRVGTSILRWFV
jgi:UDP-N-acetyl-D-mannosaminuronic acid dehydrogenase